MDAQDASPELQSWVSRGYESAQAQGAQDFILGNLGGPFGTEGYRRVLMQTLKPNVLSAIYGTTKVVP